MRTQISTSFDDSVTWLAEPVDSAGWLTGQRPTAGAAGSPTTADPLAAPAPRRSHGRRAVPARRRTRTRSRRQRTLLVDAALAPTLVRRPRRLAATVSADVPSTRRVRVEEVYDGYRMGRWARLAVTATALAAVVVLTVALTAGSAQPRLVDVIVGPGDTLWSIASQAAPDRDPRAVIEEIRELNDFSDSVLPVGVALRVPVSVE